MLNTKNNVKELDERALGVTPTTVLSPLSLPIALIIEHSIRKARQDHILTSRQEGSDLIIKDLGRTMLIHPIQNNRNLFDVQSKCLKRSGDDSRIVRPHSVHGFHHRWDNLCAVGLDGDRDEVEPFFVFRSGECVETSEVF